MPKISLPVPETLESIMRPVVLDVVRQVMEITGISSNTNLAYYGDMERSQQLNSALSRRHSDDPNMFAHSDKISMEVNETYDPDRISNEQVFGPNQLLIFEDHPLNIYMKPVYAGVETSISIQFRADNKNQAQQWRDHMKAKISQRRSLNHHSVTYSYAIPRAFLYILEKLHVLRENVAGYGQDFDTYFAAHRHPNITKVTNQSGEADLWVMPETQTRILGWFDFDLPDTAAKNNEGDAFITSFTYKFRYDRPTEIAMMYPLVVHNQLIDKTLRDEVGVVDHTDVQTSYNLATSTLLPFEAGHAVERYVHRSGYSMPSYDEFLPQTIAIKTMRVLTILFTIDQANPNVFLNLGQLGQRRFTPEMLAYLKAEAPYLPHQHGSMITVSLYRNEFWVTPSPFKITGDLDVIATTDIHLRTQHHLRIGLLTDLFFLKGQALTRLQDHGKAAIQMLEAIDPSLRERGYMPKLIGDNFVSKTSLLVAAENIIPGNRSRGKPAGFITVQSLLVQTNDINTLK